VNREEQKRPSDHRPKKPKSLGIRPGFSFPSPAAARLPGRQPSGCATSLPHRLLALLDVGGAGVGTGFAFGVVVGVFAAFLFAVGADFAGDLGEAGDVAGVLAGEFHQRGAGGEEFVDRLGAGGHFLVAVAEQVEAVGEAGFAGLEAVGRGGDQRGVALDSGAVTVMIMVAVIVLTGSEGAGGEGAGNGGSGGFENFATFHGGFLAFFVCWRMRYRAAGRLTHRPAPAINGWCLRTW